MNQRIWTMALLLAGLLRTAQAQITFVGPEQSWAQTVEKARAQQKLLFLHLEDDRCGQCNEVATQGFQSPMLREKYAAHFLSKRLNLNTDEGKRLGERFGVRGGPASLYLDPDENVLFRYNATTSYYGAYLENAEKALQQQARLGPLRELDRRYAAGERSTGFLERYIPARREAGKDYEPLIDEYMGKLPVDSLQSPRIVRFLLAQGLSIDGRARRILYGVGTGRLVDSLFLTLPYAQRVALNRQVIDQGYRKAVRLRDQSLLHQVSSFQSRTYAPDHRKGWLFTMRMLANYQYDVRDTLKYLQMVSNYAEQLVRYAVADSLRKEDRVARETQLKNARPVNGVASFSFSPPSQWYITELNTIAWRYWQMAKYREELEESAELVEEEPGAARGAPPGQRQRPGGKRGVSGYVRAPALQAQPPGRSHRVPDPRPGNAAEVGVRGGGV
jgi:hypothetical protein